ncbi:MAG: hypothetical protein ACRDAU_06845 [Clostridium sp.]
MYCGNCDEVVEDYKLICPKCGGRVKNDKKFCTNCGVKRENVEDKNCIECGHEFQMVSESKVIEQKKGSKGLRGLFNAIGGALLLLVITAWIAYSDFFATVGENTKNGYESAAQRHLNVPVDLICVGISILVLVKCIRAWKRDK